MSLSEFRARWLYRRDELQRLGAWIKGAKMCDELLADLDAALKGAALVPAAPAAETARPESAAPARWRERLWTAPPKTRMNARELAEAPGRKKRGSIDTRARNAGFASCRIASWTASWSSWSVKSDGGWRNMSKPSGSVSRLPLSWGDPQWRRGAADT